MTSKYMSRFNHSRGGSGEGGEAGGCGGAVGCCPRFVSSPGWDTRPHDATCAAAASQSAARRLPPGLLPLPLVPLLPLFTLLLAFRYQGRGLAAAAASAACSSA